MYKKVTLKSGLRIITYEMPKVRSVATAFFIGAGSRYEKEEENGISHFLEHMLFKGSKKRPTQKEIASSIEGIGGEMNGFTSQDCTGYWNKVPKEYFSLAIDVLSDMILNPLLEKKKIEKERGVVIEEINFVFDNPLHHVVFLLNKLIFPNHPLGKPIFGTKETVSKIERNDFLSYLKNLYLPQNVVLSVAGNIDHLEVVKEVEKIFKIERKEKIREWENFREEQKEIRILTHFKETDQAHLCLGFKSLPIEDKKENVLDLLNIILGQGLSSRLSLEVREKRGLAYYISSHDQKFLDTGCFFVHAGLNINKLEEGIKAILEEFKKIKRELVKNEELKKAKEFIKGGLLLSLDDSDEMTSWFGSQALFYKKIRTPEEKIKEIEKVTSQEIRKLAQEIFLKNEINLALIGPFKDKEPFLKILDL